MTSGFGFEQSVAAHIELCQGPSVTRSVVGYWGQHLGLVLTVRRGT